MNKRIFIEVKSQFCGSHFWGSCPFKEVFFLRFPHRHIFHITMVVEVNHSDRALEFFMVKQDIDKIVKRLYFREGQDIASLQEKSCEIIGDEIYNELRKENPAYCGIRSIKIDEDGENAGIIEFDPSDMPGIDPRNTAIGDKCE